jgi:2-haloacid dehalogenase
MTRVIAFDVNETLLDLRALDEPFEQLLGSSDLRGQWFAQMLQVAFVGGLTGEYVDFTTAQRAALQMVAARAGRSLSDDAIVEMVDRMSSLPPHDEVPEALARLRGTSLTVVALDSFDVVMSADAARALKPAAAPYHAVAERYGVPIGEVRLVAAHSWDVSGALAAGAKAAFVARPGMVLSPLGPQPDIVEADVATVVARIAERDVG